MQEYAAEACAHGSRNSPREGRRDRDHDLTRSVCLPSHSTQCAKVPFANQDPDPDGRREFGEVRTHQLGCLRGSGPEEPLVVTGQCTLGSIEIHGDRGFSAHLGLESTESAGQREDGN
jgi:hypothetical protein